MVVQHGDDRVIPKHMKVHKPGGWLPSDHRVHHEFLRGVISHVDKNPRDLTPALKEFKALIEGEPRIYMYFVQMFEEIPQKHPYDKDPGGSQQIRDYEHMLAVLNHLVTRAPEWTDTAEAKGVVGVPMSALLDFPMGTPSGHAAFLDPDVNKALKKVLNEWGEFLTTPESASALGNHDCGWFGKTGLSDLVEVANQPYSTWHKFEDVYVCDSTKEHYGFKSWDEFFTREVHDSARPVASPDDDNVIANACESKVYNIERDVKLRDRFFAKGQPYSVLDMLGHHPLAEDFAGGTIYQAYLGPLAYHRWHAPVSGTVRCAFRKAGTYFSEPLFEGVGDPSRDDIDKQGLNTSQGYLSALATRAIIMIEADNAAIGLVAFVGIGMDEVSSCEITVEQGQRVTKGEQTGMFHYGGSSYCLLLKKGVKVEGFPEVGKKENVPARGHLAVVKP